MPDSYVDNVVAYLKTVQGGGRAVCRAVWSETRAYAQALIDAAKKRRDAAAPEPKVAEPVVEESAEAAEPTEEGAETSAEAEVPAEAEPVVDEEAVTKYNVAKERALKLLKAMGAR